MKGNNTLTFCASQMIEMVQAYFDEHLFAEGQSPKITAITYDNTGPHFRVNVTGQDTEKEITTPNKA